MIINKRDFWAKFLYEAIEKANNAKIQNVVNVETLYKDQTYGPGPYSPKEAGVRVWYTEVDPSDT